MSAPASFLVDLGEWQTKDEAMLSVGAALNAAPDDCDCPGKCVCGFGITLRSTD